MHRTGITRGAAVGHAAWGKRADTHPKVLAALAARQVSESVGRMICLWTGKLPEKFRDESDELLIAAAAAGLELRDLGAMFAEMYERARSELPDEDPDGPLEDRALRLVTTFQGAGVLSGDLTPECAAAVTAVLDALSAPAGAEDTRTRDQRYHDALARRRCAAWSRPGCCRSGPVSRSRSGRISRWRICSGWTAAPPCKRSGPRRSAPQWAAHRAAASEGGSDGGAWLDGDAAEAIACDAAMAPIVTGDINAAALEDLVRLCIELGKLRHADADAAAPGPDAGPGPGGARAGDHRHGRRPAVRPRRPGQLPAPPPARRPPRRPQPAAGHRIHRDHPGRDPQRGHPAGPALPVGRTVRPARRGL